MSIEWADEKTIDEYTQKFVSWSEQGEVDTIELMADLGWEIVPFDIEGSGPDNMDNLDRLLELGAKFADKPSLTLMYIEYDMSVWVKA